MGETSNISLMANKLSKEVFSVFGWRQEGLQDSQIECDKKAAHKVSTHPSDVVYWYEDPYCEQRVYINTDLKSYARESIKSDQIRKALRSLGMAVDCANNSKQYEERYVHTDRAFQVIGLLFLYNHDGDFDADFSKLIDKINPNSLHIPEGRTVNLFGPDRIAILATVAGDILRMRGSGELPAADLCYFYYPDLVLARSRRIFSEAASMETLLGPWIPYCYDAVNDGRPTTNHVLYYFGDGSSSEEFMFLLDYFFRTQTHTDYNTIKIKTIRADKKAPIFLAKAKEQYSKFFFGFSEFESRLNRIVIESVTRTVVGYNEYEIGMRDGK